VNIITRRSARERRSRMTEYREADAAYRETGNKNHALWRFHAMRSPDMRDSDFVRAIEEVEGRAEDDRNRAMGLAKKYKLEFTKGDPDAEQQEK